MDDKTYSIGELSREFGVTPRAIRFYEARGLLAPRRAGQRRIFTRRDRTRLKLILRGKRLGFRLEESRELFEMYDNLNGEQAQLKRLLEIQAEKRRQLNRKRQDIESALAELDQYDRLCRDLLRDMEKKKGKTASE